MVYEPVRLRFGGTLAFSWYGAGNIKWSAGKVLYNESSFSTSSTASCELRLFGTLTAFSVFSRRTSRTDGDTLRTRRSDFERFGFALDFGFTFGFAFVLLCFRDLFRTRGDVVARLPLARVRVRRRFSSPWRVFRALALREDFGTAPFRAGCFFLPREFGNIVVARPPPAPS